MRLPGLKFLLWTACLSALCNPVRILHALRTEGPTGALAALAESLKDRLSAATALALQHSSTVRDATASLPGGGELVLALSWEPAFCELNPRKPECAAGRGRGAYDADHFALHGLWPQPQGVVYCVADERRELPLSDTTRRELREVMPGMASMLHVHEWQKHGVCYADTPEAYFTDALKLTREVNQSPLRDLFAGHIGRALAPEDIRTIAAQTFGPETANRLSVTCGRDKDSGRTLITEITIILKGKPDLKASENMARMAANAFGAGYKDRGCEGESPVVDPPGLQQ